MAAVIDVENNIFSDDRSNFLCWVNHASEVTDTLVSLQQNGSMVDVTLQADGGAIKVHRLVLSACSPLLQELLGNVDDPNPCIILPDVKMIDLKAVIDFMYRGEISFLVSQLPMLLKVAELLGVQGLNEMRSEIPKLNASESVDESMLPLVFIEEQSAAAIALNLWESDFGTEDEDSGVAVVEEVVLDNIINIDPVSMKRSKTKRDSSQKERKYSEGAIEEALKEMKAGRPLCDTAIAFNIPRTTLYMKARSAGVLSPSHKLGYTPQQLDEAVDAVKSGSSLQQASMKYNVPKTVLWRKVQACKTEDSCIRTQQSYTMEDKLAAVKALERGEQLQVICSQYPVPKTTLFREKVKLVEKGILPSNSIKRRRDSDYARVMRVEQAVAACKEGKMSQAAASTHYHVPRTTIWRYMQSMNKKAKTELKSGELNEDQEERLAEEQNDSYTIDTSNMKFVTEDGEFSPSSLIILSSVEGDNLQTSNHLVINAEESAVINEVEDEELGNKGT